MSEQAANEARNDGSSVTEVLPEFDPVHMRRDLIAMRDKYGADSPKGRACSNIVAQMEHLKDYVRPDWATHEFQTLPGLMKRQMDRLSR